MPDRRLVAYQHEGIRPDVVTLAKSLGNGLPIGACLASGTAAGCCNREPRLDFGGNPLASAAALAVTEIMRGENLAERAAEAGRIMLERFRAELEDLDDVVEIRGKGLMIGIELSRIVPAWWTRRWSSVC